MVDDWIWTADLWHQKWPQFQEYHSYLLPLEPIKAIQFRSQGGGESVALFKELFSSAVGLWVNINIDW